MKALRNARAIGHLNGERRILTSGAGVSDWSPELYLKFQDERTRPSIDLVGRISLQHPKRIIDIGCGPGNSTRVLSNRWPQSRISGLDNSPAMIAKAKADYPDQTWILADAGTFKPKAKYDIVFSNATIQWIPNHARLVMNLMGMVESGGVLAIQLPMFRDMPLGELLDGMAQDPRWGRYVRKCPRLFTYHDSSFYYDLLVGASTSIDIWETSYIHQLASPAAILDWSRSTGMKPYLDVLENEDQKQEFEADMLKAVRKAYPVQKNGKVLFPFTRLFWVACKKS
jgi:trans-aconitate 2-methyltransferase